MIRGFYYKLVVLFFVMAGASILILTIAILPSYFLSSVKINIADTKLATQMSEAVPVPDLQTEIVIKELNHKLDMIEKAEKNKFVVSQKVVDAIIREKLPTIKITDISYADSAMNGKKISIQGTAPSRENLLLFRLALENDPLFKQVDLPISNFVKGSDIQFYLSLIPA